MYECTWKRVRVVHIYSFEYKMKEAEKYQMRINISIHENRIELEAIRKYNLKIQLRRICVSQSVTARSNVDDIFHIEHISTNNFINMIIEMTV